MKREDQEEALRNAERVLDEYNTMIVPPEDADEETFEWVTECIEARDEDLVQSFFAIINENFSDEEIKEAEEEAGTQLSMNIKFIDALKKGLDKPRVLDEYNGYTLVLYRDCWGNEILFADRDNEQYGDELFYDDNDAAIQRFRQAIDMNPEHPSFE